LDLDERRRRRRYPVAMATLPDAAGSAEPPDVTVQRRLDVYAGLEQLTEQERDFTENWEKALGTKSQTEIAEDRGLSDARVSGIKNSALQKLAERLASHRFST